MTLDELEVHCLLAILSANPDINPTHATRQAIAAAKAMWEHQAARG
jgi:hypothetical protein